MTSKLKRISTDIAGYALILLGIASGWLPGPGGIPLVLAGLSLLSIHNEWAERLRNYIIKNGSDFLRKLFPQIPVVEAAYDVLCVGMLGIAIWLILRHAALWQYSLAAILIAVAILIACFNRERYQRLKNKIKKNNSVDKSHTSQAN